jgi:hypothetical protein
VLLLGPVFAMRIRLDDSGPRSEAQGHLPVAHASSH